MTAQVDPDAAWAAAVERAATRKPNEGFIYLPDKDASRALIDAEVALTGARQRARLALVMKNDEQDTVPVEGDDLVAAVEADPDVVKAAADHAAAEQAAADLEIKFHLRALEPYQYDSLQLAHPATDEQRDLGLRWNTQTYFPALLAASSVKPLTEGQAERIIAACNQGDVGRLIAMCRDLNERSSLSLGKG